MQDPNDDKKQISSGMSILDLCRHAAKTIVESLSDDDRCVIVAFDDKVLSLLSRLFSGFFSKVFDFFFVLFPRFLVFLFTKVSLARSGHISSRFHERSRKKESNRSFGFFG